MFTHLSYKIICARSSVGLERMPPEHKVTGSNPVGRTTENTTLSTTPPENRGCSLFIPKTLCFSVNTS